MDAVEDFVSRVVAPHDPDGDHGAPGEGDDLPGPAGLPGAVTDHLPVSLVDLLKPKSEIARRTIHLKLQ